MKIFITPITAQTEESNFLKQTISSHFGHLNLIDILNEVDIRTGFTKKFITLGSRMVLDQEDKRQKILLCSYALGTNIGLARTSQLSGMSYEGLRHIKRFYFQPDNLREVIKYLSDSALTVYDEKLLGKLSKILVSDSKQISSFSDNMVTQWHPRYKRKGVMIYWHLNKNHICIFSQLKNCTSSEVASMLNGILNHKTSLDVEGQCVDTHGQSYIGFALSFLLGFDLLPRIKNIGSATLYVPYDMDLQNIQPIIKDKIKFDLIEPYYDDCVRIVTQLRNGKSDAFSIIRQFSALNYGNPLFKALREIGRAQKTIFLCRYLHSESLRQEINAGLNIVENWNSMIKFVHYAKSIDAPSNNIDDQEVSILTLHLIQLCMTYVNIVMLQNLLKKKLLPKGQYTSSFYSHINPYGDINFSFTKRLNIGD